MNLFSQKKKLQNQLPPLKSQQRPYNIRKSPYTDIKSSRLLQAEAGIIKSTNPQKRSVRSKESAPSLSFSLSDFELGKCLGKGKGGRVFIASTNYKDYALKIIPKE